MQQAQKLRILIADDQILVREGLATILSRQKHLEVVGQTDKLAQVLEYCRLQRPDVLLIDLRLQEADTVETIQKIHQDFPGVSILMVSNYDGSEDIYRSLRAGARGYVHKNVSDSELMDAIQSVSSGRRYISPQIADRLAERMDRSTLTPREMEVLQFIVRGKSNKEIADLLKVTEGTIKYHINGILTKLGVSDRTQAATAALLRGIIHPQDL